METVLLRSDRRKVRWVAQIVETYEHKISMSGMRTLKRRTMRKPKAVCSNCGNIYWRSRWKHGTESGIIKCGVRTCVGFLWIFNDDKLGYAVAKLDLDKRIVQAKLHVLRGKIDG